MKSSAALLIILMTSLSAWCRVDPLWAPEKKDTLGLLSAKQANRIRIAIRGAYNPHRTQSNPVSSHFGECMEVRIENVTDSVLHLVLPCGTVLLSLDSSAQNMLVSQTRYFTLAPRQKKYERINALCGELHKNAPDVYVNYEVGKQAAEPLLRLAHVIEANSAQNKAGQYAVWAVTDNATKNELGEDYELLQASQRLLSMAGISFNIMGRQEAVAAVAAVKNSANKANTAVINTSDADNTMTVEGTGATTLVDSAYIAVGNKTDDIGIAANSVGNNEQAEYDAPRGDASELMVYAIGALLLGLGIYALGKKATRRNA